MKKLIGILALVTILCLALALPGLAVKIAPYSQPLHDIMHWDAKSAKLIIQNPEGESLTVSWPVTVDFWNYDGATWTFDLPDGDTFVFAKAFSDTLEISGGTEAINITSTTSAFGLLYDVDMPTQIGANVEGIKVILERTADVVIGTSNIIGAEFIIKQGSDSYAAGMAPQITGVRIAIAGANTKATVYGLKCETQQGGFINYVGMFSVNADCVLHSSGAVLYVRSYVAAAHALVKIEQPAATTAAKGLYITDNAGTGTITDAIYFDCRNSTSVLRFATGTGPISIISDAMTKNPESDVEDGYLTVYVGTNAYQVPIYSD